MGIVFSLYKRNPKERYEIGKPRNGFPEGMEPPGLIAQMDTLLTEYNKQRGDTSALMKFSRAMLPLTDPGLAAMSSMVGDTGNYDVFKMSKWSQQELADIIYRAVGYVFSNKDALELADKLLAWAGDEDVILVPDEETEFLERAGWPKRGYKLVNP